MFSLSTNFGTTNETQILNINKNFMGPFILWLKLQLNNNVAFRFVYLHLKRMLIIIYFFIYYVYGPSAQL